MSRNRVSEITKVFVMSIVLIFCNLSLSSSALCATHSSLCTWATSWRAKSVWDFVWTEDMTNFLKQYESNRDKYPTFESFSPEFVHYLNDYITRAK